MCLVWNDEKLRSFQSSQLMRCWVGVRRGEKSVWQKDRLAVFRFLGGNTSLLLGECLNGWLGCGERKSC